MSLEKLTLANNVINDLTEISHLVNLISLKELSIQNNPCLEFNGSGVYPFIILKKFSFYEILMKLFIITNNFFLKL